MNDRVVIQLDSEGVADVRLNRADKMNAIDSAMIEGILAAQDQLRAEPRLRAVVLHGEGRAFCAGLDISRFRAMGSTRWPAALMASRTRHNSPPGVGAISPCR